jgi:hypothetical protein
VKSENRLIERHTTVGSYHLSPASGFAVKIQAFCDFIVIASLMQVENITEKLFSLTIPLASAQA